MASSKRLIAHYRSMAYWHAGLSRITACWRAAEIGVEYTPEERVKLCEASRMLEKAKDLVSEIWSARIGAAVTKEARKESFR